MSVLYSVPPFGKQMQHGVGRSINRVKPDAGDYRPLSALNGPCGERSVMVVCPDEARLTGYRREGVREGEDAKLPIG